MKREQANLQSSVSHTSFTVSSYHQTLPLLPPCIAIGYRGPHGGEDPLDYGEIFTEIQYKIVLYFLPKIKKIEKSESSSEKLKHIYQITSK